MNDETMAKLNEVAYDRLTMAMNNADGSKEQTAFMKEALDAIDRIIELEKLDDARKDKRDEKKWNRIFKAAEIGGTIWLIPTMNYLFNMKFAKQICNFEKDYTFTTTPGRTLGSLFRRK